MLLHQLCYNGSHLRAQLHAGETAARNHLVEEFPQILSEGVMVEEVR
jgi:hypothetical protein